MPPTKIMGRLNPFSLNHNYRAWASRLKLLLQKVVHDHQLVSAPHRWEIRRAHQVQAHWPPECAGYRRHPAVAGYSHPPSSNRGPPVLPCRRLSSGRIIMLHHWTAKWLLAFCSLYGQWHPSTYSTPRLKPGGLAEAATSALPNPSPITHPMLHCQ